MIEETEPQLRRRPELLLSRHHLLAGAARAAADAEQPAGRVRAAVRRRQHRRRSARRAAQQSISLLDSVIDEAAALQRTLPAADRTRLDQYLTDVREIERRMQKAGAAALRRSPVPAAPTGIPRDVEEHIKLMFDLQVLAWQADITRVSTLLLSQGAERRGLPEERRPRRVPHAVAPLEHPGEQGPVRDAEPLSRRRCSRTSWTSCSRRRTATASLLDHSTGAVRQRHERRQPAQSHRSADRRWPAARRDA